MGNSSSCPECGNNIPIFDEERGEIICRNCGLVVEEKIISTTGKKIKGQIYSEDFLSVYKGRKPFMGKPNKDFSKKYLPPKAMEIFKRLKYIDSYLSKEEKRVKNALDEFKILSSILSLSKNRKERISLFIQKFMKYNLLQGKSYLSFVSAATLLVLRKESVPIGLKEMAEILSLDLKKLTKAYFFLIKKTRQRIPKQNLKKLIEKFCENLNLPQETQTLCCSLSDKLNTDFSGKNPRGIAGAIIYIIANANNANKKERRITQKEISKVAKITETTIRERIEDIKKLFLNSILSEKNT